jgi:hypothetical protein
MKLYALTNEYNKAFEFLEKEGFGDEIIEDTLSSMIVSIEEKAINVSKYIKDIESDISGMLVAEQNINRRRKIAEKKVDRLKEYLKTNMESSGISKISCPYFDITIKKCPKSLEIKDGVEPHPDYMRVKLEHDKQSLKKVLKDGVSLDWAKLVSKYRVEIK